MNMVIHHYVIHHYEDRLYMFATAPSQRRSARSEDRWNPRTSSYRPVDVPVM